MRKKRLYHILKIAIAFLIAGVAYGIFFLCTGIGLACPIRFVTGWKCPGCGVTHMCAALLCLDFASAFAANPALLLLSPLLAAVFAKYVKTYVNTGRWQADRVQNAIMWICVVILILYGAARNIFPI